MSNIKLRVVPIEHIGRAMAKTFNAALISVAPHQQELGLQQSCISCTYFDEDGRKSGTKEQCMAYKERPPARVIAFGCPNYSDADDIPF